MIGDEAVHWKDIKIDGIAKIERVIEEFVVWQIGIIPGAKFTVKITEQVNGRYEGHTNIMVKDVLGTAYCAVGFGDTIERALEETIHRHMQQISDIKGEPTDDDFDWLDPRDF